MKRAERLTLWVEQMREAAGDACRYVDGLDFATFERDKRTQQAVVLNLLLIGEVASRIAEGAPGFIAAHPEIPWAAMRGMRNRIAHGYFELDIEVVWDTVRDAVPELAVKLPGLLQAAGEFDAE
ncbi:HepT-like ribonuclease domain-containing protein [Thauera mechernichensis]